jgi:hypothetical protein
MTHGVPSRKHVLWSVVMMTDCAAKESSPRRPAARATISNAALFGVSRTILMEGSPYLPFCAYHQDTRESQLKECETTVEVEDGLGLEAAPCSILLVHRRHRCHCDQEEKCTPVCDRKRNRAAKHAK